MWNAMKQNHMLLNLFNCTHAVHSFIVPPLVFLPSYSPLPHQNPSPRIVPLPPPFLHFSVRLVSTGVPTFRRVHHSISSALDYDQHTEGATGAFYSRRNRSTGNPRPGQRRWLGIDGGIRLRNWKGGQNYFHLDVTRGMRKMFRIVLWKFDCIGLWLDNLVHR